MYVFRAAHVVFVCSPLRKTTALPLRVPWLPVEASAPPSSFVVHISMSIVVLVWPKSRQSYLFVLPFLPSSTIPCSPILCPLLPTLAINRLSTYFSQSVWVSPSSG